MITVEKILNTIGIYPHRNGYHYIRDMIALTLETDNTTMKPLYKKVAQMYNVKVHSIQSSIRKASEASFNSNKQLYLNVFLGANACDEMRPLTNAELIFFISNYLKSDCYDKSKEISDIIKVIGID